MTDQYDDNTRTHVIRNAIEGKPYVIWLVVAVVCLLIVTKSTYFPASGGENISDELQEEAILAQDIIDDFRCPCGCGMLLPGSSKGQACFGCSVGKAEVSRVLEGFSKGRPPLEIASELSEPVLVDVFSDYTDTNLPVIWQRAKQVAAEFNQHRVVLRPPGLTEAARLAIHYADCARAEGKFSQMQEALIKHQGPWNELALTELFVEQGFDETNITECINQVDVRAQIAKDIQHAQRRRVVTFPAISVNRKLTSTTESALRRAIRDVIFEGSI